MSSDKEETSRKTSLSIQFDSPVVSRFHPLKPRRTI